MPNSTDAAVRARRLLALLPHLKRGESTPLADLAAAVGATTAEVAADLATLTLCGVPPFSPLDMVDLEIDGESVTVNMDPPGLDRQLKLSANEARALVAALDTAGYDDDSPLRRKLAEATTDTVPSDEIARTVRTGTAPGGIADLYAALAGAAAEHDKVSITYLTGTTGRMSERVVHPWALVNRLGAWYLVAFCEGVGEERVFRLDRIRAVAQTGERFTPPSDKRMSVTPSAERLPVAEVRFVPGATLPDGREWPGVSLEPADDGSVIARVPYQGVAWIARRVVARLGEAEAVSPPEVRDAVRTMAAAMLTDLR